MEAQKEVISFTDFQNGFNFQPQNHFMIGVERECFLVQEEKIVPIAEQVLSFLRASTNGRSHCFGYELSACQLEDRTAGPCRLENLRADLLKNEEDIRTAEKELGFSRIYCGAGPEDIFLVHYPNPRYGAIVAKMPIEALRAACRVTGVHIHVGMPNHKIALRVYNGVVDHFDFLCGNTYSPRIQLFMNHLVNGACHPPKYLSWEYFYQRALDQGFAKDPRRLWDFIRISPLGTIEFRMFDSTESIEQIISWAALCQKLCYEQG